MDPAVSPRSLDWLLGELQDPFAYPHDVEKISVVQTHVSCVFLTGSCVYKIKKPVKFSFLDYSTLEQRRFFCEEEVRLNRRLCPDVYLDVVPLTLAEGRLRVGGSGETVEWAVRMRQLRVADMLPARLLAGTAERPLIEALAQRLADFHAHAATDNTIRAFGDPDAFNDTLAFTLQTMEDAAADVLPEPTRHALHKGLQERFYQTMGLMRLRQQQGRIRDCHGDLRAQNICLDARYEGGIQVFDCIEFNNSLRYIDVAADIAYLAMDLDLAGRADLRVCLLDAYEAAANDGSLHQILPFYQAYRALVRGNIALLAAKEQEIAPDEREAHLQTARAAYDLARCFLARRLRPALVIMVGYSGSGKSVLAQELCRRLPAIKISSDHVRKEMAGVDAATGLPPSHYAASQRADVYTELRHRAKVFLARHENVLLDATFLPPEERCAAADLAREMRAELWIVECRCSEEVIRQRLKARHAAPNASDADDAVYERQKQAYPQKEWLVTEHFKATGHILADTGGTLNAAVDEVISHFCPLSRI